MAVISTALGSRLQLVVQTGLDGEGNPLLKTRSYNRIKSNATDEDVYQFATTMAGLQKHSMFEINRVNEARLEQE